MFVSVFTAALLGQSAVDVQLSDAYNGFTQYYLTNGRLGEPGTDTIFRLIVEPSAIATLTTSDNSDHSSYWEIENNGKAQDRILFPSTKLEAEFDVNAEYNAISISMLAAEGVTLCNNALYLGEQPPEACTSKTFSTTLCDTDEGCWYEIVMNDVPGLARFNAELPVLPEGCRRAEMVTSVGSTPICISEDGEFNPGHAQASVHMVSPLHQVLYINDTGTSNAEGTIFAFAIVLILVVWTTHSSAFVQGTMTLKGMSKACVIACDIVVTAATASTFALIRSGVMFCPPETSQAVGEHGGVLSLALSGTTIVVGAFFASIMLFVSLHGKRVGTADKKTLTVFTGRTRCFFEVVLLLILHLHFPRPMGQSLRRTVGFFVGVTAAIVIGRDSAEVTGCLVNDIIYYAWALTALVTIVVNLLLPITFVSAGFSNNSAAMIASVIAIGSSSAGYVYKHA